ncbi:MAG: hypothetical protein JNK56_18050 [Myxococcales bacterium]|nr:hypothetical protein [Myxococcales bacterium]
MTLRPAPSTRLRRALIVPAALVVSSLASACADKPDDTSDTAATTSTGTTAATSTGSGSTTAPTSGTTGSELPDCPMYTDNPETCSSMVECIYLINQAACIVRCNYFPDQASCEAQAYCYWEAGGCYLAV